MQFKIAMSNNEGVDSASEARRCHAYPLDRLLSPDAEMVRVWLDGGEQKGEDGVWS